MFVRIPKSNIFINVNTISEILVGDAIPHVGYQRKYSHGYFVRFMTPRGLITYDEFKTEHEALDFVEKLIKKC